MKFSPLHIGLAFSVALHGILILSAMQLERPDVREQMRTVKLRMVKKAREERDEQRKQKEIKEALKKLELDKKRKLKEARPEDLQKVKEAQEKLTELRRKLAEEAEKRRAELAKKKEELKPKPKPAEKPEVKPPPRAQEKLAEKAKKPEKKARKKRTRRKEKSVKPAEGEKPAPPTPEMAGAKRGAAIDLDFAMNGGTSSGDQGGSAVNVRAGDGMDVPEEGYNDDPATALSEQPTADELFTDGEEFQDESAVGDEEAALPDEDGKVGPGGGPIAGKKRDPRARKVATTSKHRVTRDAKMKKLVAPRYPDEIRALEIQGRVYVLVTVDKEGKVADVALKKGLHPALDKVAVETAWELEFEPALQEGEPVGVKITVPFLFLLE